MSLAAVLMVITGFDAEVAMLQILSSRPECAFRSEDCCSTMHDGIAYSPCHGFVVDPWGEVSSRRLQCRLAWRYCNATHWQEAANIGKFVLAQVSCGTTSSHDQSMQLSGCCACAVIQLLPTRLRISLALQFATCRGGCLHCLHWLLQWLPMEVDKHKAGLQRMLTSEVGLLSSNY